jgi:hypothetical protein
MAAMLVRGAPAAPYHAGDWPDPNLHSNFHHRLTACRKLPPLKHREEAKWLALAEWLASGHDRGVGAGRDGRI